MADAGYEVTLLGRPPASEPDTWQLGGAMRPACRCPSRVRAMRSAGGL